MMLAAKEAGADVVKFQKRTPRALLSEIEYNNPHPNPINSYGKTRQGQIVHKTAIKVVHDEKKT